MVKGTNFIENLLLACGANSTFLSEQTVATPISFLQDAFYEGIICAERHLDVDFKLVEHRPAIPLLPHSFPHL